MKSEYIFSRIFRDVRLIVIRFIAGVCGAHIILVSACGKAPGEKPGTKGGTSFLTFSGGMGYNPPLLWARFLKGG